VFIAAEALSIPAGGSITSNGSHGAGGSIYLWANTVANDGAVTGIGGGAVGRTAVHGPVSGTGTFDPAPTAI
jgi:hypothetical protein